MVDHLQRSEMFRKMVLTEADRMLSVSEPPMSAAGIIFRFAAMGVCMLAMFGILFAVASM